MATGLIRAYLAAHGRNRNHAAQGRGRQDQERQRQADNGGTQRWGKFRRHHPCPPGYCPKSGNTGISTEGFPSGGGQTTTFDPSPAAASASQSKTRAFTLVTPRPMSAGLHLGGATSISPATLPGPLQADTSACLAKPRLNASVGSANPLLRKERWRRGHRIECDGPECRDEGLNPAGGFARCVLGWQAWRLGDQPAPANPRTRRRARRHGDENQS